jgi:hypothetical protein
MNSYGWCWDDERQEFVEKGGTLYYRVNDATTKMREILLAEHGDKRMRLFTAPITLELYCDDDINQETIENWCLKATRLILHADQHGMGPVNESLGLVSVNWGQLEEISPKETP